jgi:hypothetical protein
MDHAFCVSGVEIMKEKLQCKVMYNEKGFPASDIKHFVKLLRIFYW